MPHLSALGIWIVGFMLWSGLAHAETSSERLNILFCFADDWGRYASIYTHLDARPSPNEVVRTPQPAPSRHG